MEDDRLPPTLTNIPIELLFLISDFLSPADTVCLALCNHGLSAALSSGGQKPLKHQLPQGNPGDMENERSLCLSRLSLDNSQYYLCCACLRLHFWQDVPPPPRFKPRECFRSLEREHRWLAKPLGVVHYPAYSDYQLHFDHAQLAMRRFYHGPRYGITTDSLFHSEVRVNRLADFAVQSASQGMTEERFLNEHMTSVVSFEARVCPCPTPSLCLRIQGLAVVKRQNGPVLLPERSIVWICGHIGTYQSDFSDLVKAHIDAYSSGAVKAADFGRCRKCNTAYHLELRELGTHDLGLIITRWIDLGPCLTPKDPRWRSHLLTESHLEVDAQDLVADPRLRFEQGLVDQRSKNALSDEELFLRNLSFLEDRRYKAILAKVPASSMRSTRPEARQRRSSDCIVM